MALSKSRGDREYNKFLERDDGQTAVAVDVEISDKSAGGSLSAGYKSPSDFTATYTSASTITLTGVPFTIADSSQISYVKVVNTSTNISLLYTAGSANITFAVSSNVITIYSSGAVITTLTTNDVYEIGINSQSKAYDSSLDVGKSIEQSPIWSRYTDSEAILAAAQTMTATVADVGSEIDVRGYNTLTLFMTSTIQQANDLRIAFMGKHESAGTEEMPLDDGFITIAGTTVAAPSTAALYYFEQTEDVNADWTIKINVEGIAYIQVRAFEGTDGGTDATIDTLDAIKQY